ncbi:MAG: 4Fe-4S [Geobacteraceae bacterium]|nr:MAG: 4Fe-4S [Geobacteraceae bacterium]
MHHARIAPQRELIQWLSTLLLLVIPFFRVGGESLLRLDAPSRTLLFFGAKVRIEEFYLFLVAVLVIVMGFLLVTMVFGRVWCGWLCPQNTLADLVEYLDRKVTGSLGKNIVSRMARQMVYLLISMVMAANLVWYFISPYDFFPRLLSGEIGFVAGTTLYIVTLAVYLDIVLVRRSFCKAVCPYGRMQLMTMDKNTLTLEFDRERGGLCIQCRSCERVCPMGIDIKQGLQVECINCGRCLDVCREVMAKTEREGLIHYTFGRSAEGGGRPINLKSSLLAGITLVLAAVLFWGAAARTEATIKIQRGGSGEVRRLDDGAVAVFYTAYLENRSASTGRYDIAVRVPGGLKTELLGSVRGIEVPPNENRRVDFLVKISPAPLSARQVTFLLVRGGKVMADAKGLFPGQ